MAHQTDRITDICRFVGAHFEPGDQIEIRYLKDGAAYSNFLPARDVVTTAKPIIATNAEPRRFNAYVGGNPRTGSIGTAEGVKLCRSVFAEWDDATIEEGLERIAAIGLPRPTSIIHSGRGPHFWWRLTEPLGDTGAWLDLMRWIATAVGSDPMICDLPRIMRLPGTRNWKHAGEVWAQLIECEPSRRYSLSQLSPSTPMPTIEEFKRLLSSKAKPVRDADASPPTSSPIAVDLGATVDEIVIEGGLDDAPGVEEGGRNHRLAQLVGAALASGQAEADILPAALAFGARCRPAMPRSEIESVVESIASRDRRRRDVEDAAIDSIEVKPSAWPEAPALAMRHGILAQVLDAVAPHTEADPVAVAAALVVGFGNVVGRGPHCFISGTRHGVNEFVCITGASARARKGTATEIALLLLRDADPAWRKERVQRGLVSGEGLIDRVADPQIDIDAKPRKGGGDAFDCTVAQGGGTLDKRLLIDERELASVFRAGARRDNTLSQTLRSAWDGGDLGTLAKTALRMATAPHVSLIGNITGGELELVRSNVDLAGGLFNRILWCVARRTRLLPDGGPGLLRAIEPATVALAELVAFATDVGEMPLTRAAQSRWREVYPSLATMTAPGIAGMCLERSETHGRRLAMLMALLRGRADVDAGDIDAAIDLLRYFEASVRMLFGGVADRPLDTKLLELVRMHPGSTRSELYRRLGSRTPAEQIVEALDRLKQGGALAERVVATGGRSRAEYILATVVATPEEVPTSYILHQGEPAAPAQALGMMSLEEWGSLQGSPVRRDPPAMQDAGCNNPSPEPPATDDDLPAPDAFYTPAPATLAPEAPADPLDGLADGAAVDEIAIAIPKPRAKAIGRRPRKPPAPPLLAFPDADADGEAPDSDLPF